MRASRFLHHRVDRFLAVSSAVARGSRAGLPAGTEVVTHPPMVPDDLLRVDRETPRPEFLPAEDGFVMFAGALGLHKGIDVLLAARRRMRNAVPLVLLGMPSHDTPRIDDPGITVVRNVPHPQVMASWRRASVAVVPSVGNEALGLVAVEASLPDIGVMTLPRIPFSPRLLRSAQDSPGLSAAKRLALPGYVVAKGLRRKVTDVRRRLLPPAPR